MSSKTDKPGPARDRQARLAEALRANLHRRKQQARARADEAPAAQAPQDDGRTEHEDRA